LQGVGNATFKNESEVIASVKDLHDVRSFIKLFWKSRVFFLFLDLEPR